jgi:hypothetical protein
MGERDGQEQVTRDVRAATVRQSGHAASGQEGHGWRRPPHWRRPAAGGQRGGCARGGHMRAVARKENVVVFLIF